MSTQAKLRRGTTLEHSTFTGALAEITVDTDKKTVVVHDGVTVGGAGLLRSDQARGMTLTEYFLVSGTYTIANKPGLKRIRVHAYGGGAGGTNGAPYGGGGGGQGAHGFVELDVSQLATNTAVTIGAGGAASAVGGTTTFGTFISAGGGVVGAASGAYYGAPGGKGGTATGTNVIDLGSDAGSPCQYAYQAANRACGGSGGGSGGGVGVNGGTGSAGTGVSGGGGAGSGQAGVGGAGAHGHVMIEEIYGEV